MNTAIKNSYKYRIDDRRYMRTTEEVLEQKRLDEMNRKLDEIKRELEGPNI
jgi:hypothetical protein